MRTLLLVGVLAHFASGQVSEQCGALLECLEKVESEKERCAAILAEADEEGLQEIAGESQSQKQKCNADVREHQEERQRLAAIKDRAFGECLQRRPSRPLGERKAEECAASLERYRASLGRVRRQAGKSANREARKERNRYGVTWIANGMNKRLELGIGCRALKEAGRWEDWKELRGKKKEFRQCKQESRRLKQSCKGLTNCCSEASVCHLEYELSETHDGIKRAKLAMIEGRRACAANADDLDVVNEDEIVENQF